MQRLCAAENGREGLQCSTNHIVEGLLSGKRTASRLRVEAQRPGSRILRSVPFRHRLVPDAPRGPVFRDLLKKVAVRVEEERKLRGKVVYLHAATQRPFDVFHSVAQREGEFLDGRRAGFTDVIAAD